MKIPTYLYPCEVIDNDSQNSDRGEKDGRVQIYYEPVMSGWKANDYPWAKQDREFTSDIPEVGDVIWVWFADPTHWRHPFYRNKIDLKSYNDHSKYEDEVGSVVGAVSEYPDVKFWSLANGCTIAMSSGDDAEVTIYNSSGGYIFIDKDGKFKLQNDASDLKDILKDIQSLLQNILTVTFWQGNLGAPLVYTQATDLTTATQLLTKIDDLMES